MVEYVTNIADLHAESIELRSAGLVAKSSRPLELIPKLADAQGIEDYSRYTLIATAIESREQIVWFQSPCRIMGSERRMIRQAVLHANYDVMR